MSSCSGGEVVVVVVVVDSFVVELSVLEELIMETFMIMCLRTRHQARQMAI